MGATGDLCKDTAKCRHLHIAHILAYMCMRLRRRSDATPCKQSVHYRATLQGVRRSATDIRSYRTESKESGAREKSEWKMTF